MNNILPQVKALGKKQKLCLYHASPIFREIKFLCPPRYTCTSHYCHRELCMSTGGKKRCGASKWMRVGKTEVVSFHALPSVREGGVSSWVFHEWDVITKKTRSGVPEVAVGTSRIRDSALMQGCPFTVGQELGSDVPPLPRAVSKQLLGWRLLNCITGQWRLVKTLMFLTRAQVKPLLSGIF